MMNIKISSIAYVLLPGTLLCVQPTSGWVATTGITPSSAALRARSEGTWQIEAMAAAAGKQRVYAVVGLEVQYESDEDAQLSALWKFSEGKYEPAELWAQRGFLKLCTEIGKDLGVVRTSCWVEDFKAWVIARKGRYPVPEKTFHPLVMEFLAEDPESAKHVWIRGGKIVAWYAAFDVDIPQLLGQTNKKN